MNYQYWDPASFIQGAIPMQSPSHKELVINWHITEACNYSCRYCYAHWCKNKQRELVHDTEGVKTLLLAISQYFGTNHTNNRLYWQLNYSSVRLNIAGGEPLLYPQKIMEIAEISDDLDIRLSLITNDSLFNDNLISYLAPKLCMLGISIDSDTPQTNRSIGRTDHKGRKLDASSLTEHIQAARKLNPELRIKLNTVVNIENWEEELSGLLNKVRPERWKVLRMLPVLNDDLAINDEQFQSFIDRHPSFSDVMSIEDNDEMSESYLMIDPLGRFFQNTPNSSGQGYLYSDPILSVGVASALRSIQFSPEKYQRRYKEVNL